MFLSLKKCWIRRCRSWIAIVSILRSRSSQIILIRSALQFFQYVSNFPDFLDCSPVSFKSRSKSCGPLFQHLQSGLQRNSFKFVSKDHHSYKLRVFKSGDCAGLLKMKQFGHASVDFSTNLEISTFLHLVEHYLIPLAHSYQNYGTQFHRQ